MSFYSPSHENPNCQCWPHLAAAFFCKYGHMTECHFPLTCEEAECGHYVREMEAEELGWEDWEEDEP